MLTTIELWDDAALASLIAGATLLGADLKAGLIVGTPALTHQSVIADITEPAYAGYVRQSVLMGPVIRDPINGISCLAAGLNWQEGGAITPVTIPLLLGFEMFAVPQNLVDALSAFTTVLQWIQTSATPGLTTILV